MNKDALVKYVIKKISRDTYSENNVERIDETYQVLAEVCDDLNNFSKNGYPWENEMWESKRKTPAIQVNDIKAKQLENNLKKSRDSLKKIVNILDKIESIDIEKQLHQRLDKAADFQRDIKDVTKTVELIREKTKEDKAVGRLMKVVDKILEDKTLKKVMKVYDAEKAESFDENAINMGFYAKLFRDLNIFVGDKPSHRVLRNLGKKKKVIKVKKRSSFVSEVYGELSK